MKRESRIPAEWGSSRRGDDPAFVMANPAEMKLLATAPHFPDYLRIWFFAAANVCANGHLPLKQNALRWVLGDDVNGVRVQAPTETVTNAIKAAKGKGLLDPASRALCLIPARKLIAQGMGKPDDPCWRCDKVRRPSRRTLTSVSRVA